MKNSNKYKMDLKQSNINNNNNIFHMQMGIILNRNFSNSKCKCIKLTKINIILITIQVIIFKEKTSNLKMILKIINYRNLKYHNLKRMKKMKLTINIKQGKILKINILYII